MAKTKKTLHEELRARYMAQVEELLTNSGETVLRVASNQYAIPCCDSEQNDEFVVITVQVPNGSRDGDVYDGYALATDYEAKTAEKEREKAEREAKKQAKIERDKAEREAKKRAREERNKNAES